ncbi:hypothetical protein SAMN02745866_00675 [Alteromonadaceae bacterium Bs31]|nr:hypothetical protein SAMN02745866_00675 [Alteromonadaceae bacterium Bs31]
MRRAEEQKSIAYCQDAEDFYRKISTFKHHCDSGYHVMVLADKETDEMITREQ